jgi:hypothetical protein
MAATPEDGALTGGQTVKPDASGQEPSLSPAPKMSDLHPAWGCSANRRMRARMSGGVGGAGVSPAPTRL